MFNNGIIGKLGKHYKSVFNAIMSNCKPEVKKC